MNIILQLWLYKLRLISNRTIKENQKKHRINLLRKIKAFVYYSGQSKTFRRGNFE